MRQRQKIQEVLRELEQAQTAPHPGAWRAYWRKVTHFDHGKMEPWMALRNALGVTLPLAAGVALGMPRPGLAIATGALQVAYSDGHDPYRRRFKRMLGSSVLCASAVAVGGLAGQHTALAILVLVAWAFAAGLMVILGAAAESLGVVSLVMLIIYVAQPLTARQALLAGLLALIGGLLQTGLSLALWPFRRYEPERRALASLYQELARVATNPVDTGKAPPASAQISLTQQTLAGLGDDHSAEGERYWSLLNQAERIRLSILTLRVSADDKFLPVTAEILQAIAESLLSHEPPDNAGQQLQNLEMLAESHRTFQTDALVGQLRSGLRTATESTPAGEESIAIGVEAQPWQKRFSGNLAKLQANLSLSSAACRHAIRLAGCLAIGELVAHSVQSQRSYWLAITVVLVLKPDFTMTFSRGLLRIGGTLLGLVLATILFHIVPADIGMEVVLAGMLTFCLRWLGGANYGAFTTAVSALIVVMFVFAGLSPKSVILARGEMTLLGGLLALCAYIFWPTWERTQVPEGMARLLDNYRAYFHEVVNDGPELDRIRLAARLARSNLEASVDRLKSEPGTSEAESHLLTAILASSHRFVAAAMAIETTSLQSEPAPDAFRDFSKDVEASLELLSDDLRGLNREGRQLPDLREDYRRMLPIADPVVREEADRMTNSLNTLWEQVLRWKRLT